MKLSEWLAGQSPHNSPERARFVMRLFKGQKMEMITRTPEAESKGLEKAKGDHTKPPGSVT